MAYFFSLFFGVMLLVAGLGWGVLAGRVCGRKGIDVGLAIPLGLAVMVGLGGVLNLAAAINRWAVGAILLVGFGAAVIYLLRSESRRELAGLIAPPEGALLRVLFGLTVLLLLLRFLAAGFSVHFNPDDDYHAYFVFPEKMMQMGQMGIDPYSGRRNESALGGSYFLEAMSLFYSDIRNANMIDAGVGLAAFWIALAALIRRWNVTGWGAVLPLFLVAFVLPPKANTTSILLASAMVVGLYRLLADESGRFEVGGSVLAGLLVGGLCALKSSFIPPAVLFVVFAAVMAMRAQPGRAIRSFLIIAAMAFLAVMPWMLAMRASAGTFLYPVLGHGDRSLPPASEGMGGSTVLKVIAFGCPWLLAGLLLILRRPVSLSARQGAALLAASGVGSIAVGTATSGVGFVRQCYAFIFPAALIFIVLAHAGGGGGPALRLGKITKIFGCLTIAGFIAFGVAWGIWRRGFVQDAHDIADGVRGRVLVTDADWAAAAKVQASVPPGQRMVVDLFRLPSDETNAAFDKPFVFDFGRNEIFTCDIAGSWSPAGAGHWPAGVNAFSLRKALLAEHVRYLAFSYRDYPAAREEGLKEMDGQYAWTRAAVARSVEAQDAMDDLGRVCRRVFDDGAVFVIDLGQPMWAGGAPSSTRRVP